MNLMSTADCLSSRVSDLCRLAVHVFDEQSRRVRRIRSVRKELQIDLTPWIRRPPGRTMNTSCYVSVSVLKFGHVRSPPLEGIV